MASRHRNSEAPHLEPGRCVVSRPAPDLCAFDAFDTFVHIRKRSRLNASVEVVEERSTCGMRLVRVRLGRLKRKNRVHYKIPIARDAKSATMVNEIIACSIVSTLAHRERTGVSDGEN